MNAKVERLREFLEGEAKKAFHEMLDDPKNSQLKSLMTLLSAKKTEVYDSFEIIFADGYKRGFVAAVKSMLKDAGS